jgi:hypothetical protein
VTCSDVRTALEAEPAGQDPALLAHVGTCAACAEYRDRLLELDRRVRAALAVPVPHSTRTSLAAVLERAGREAPTSLPPPRATRRPFARAPLARLALAASVASVAVVTGLLWLGYPRATLADDVVAHMAHEPGAWRTTREVPTERLSAVLGRGDVTLHPASLDVTYAQTCWFRGRRAPHLVVQSATGPVTVMVLTHEVVTAREPFVEDGYRGVLVPAPRGALAVLARDAGDVDDVAARALAALQY